MRGKIFCDTFYLEIKLFKTVQAKFCRKFNLTIIPENPNLSLGTQISSQKVSKQPQQEGKKKKQTKKPPRSGRWLTARYPDDVDALRD